MQELRNNTFAIVEPFLSAFNYHTVLKTTIDGSTSGHIYVNDLDSPKIVFVQFRHRAFIMGDLNASNMLDFERFFTDEVFENCRNTDASMVRLTAKPEAWLISLESSLKTLKPIFFDYQIYQYQLSDSEGKPKIPEGFELRLVNKALVGETFEGKDELLEEMCSERESVNAFLDNSFGIVAFHGGKLAGWCLSEYNHKNRCEVGIATMPPFQKQGLAKAMTLEFKNLAYEQGVDTVLWHCYKSNHPSQRTALSAGFELIDEHKVINIYLEPAARFAVHGNVEF
ncbi:MAG: GNAT family N-acetyltransferase [Chloroflexota bacterium]|nr:GNAT family N-acetyltransferase [Chloroflexota bacterium]